MSSSTKDIKNLSNSNCSKCNSNNVIYYASPETPMPKDYPYLCNTCGHYLPIEIRNLVYIKLRSIV